jgi:hypothetical protein
MLPLLWTVSIALTLFRRQVGFSSFADEPANVQRARYDYARATTEYSDALIARDAGLRVGRTLAEMQKIEQRIKAAKANLDLTGGRLGLATGAELSADEQRAVDAANRETPKATSRSVAVPDARPATAPGSRPAAVPGARPATAPGSAPATAPGSAPATVPGARPAAVPGSSGVPRTTVATEETKPGALEVQRRQGPGDISGFSRGVATTTPQRATAVPGHASSASTPGQSVAVRNTKVKPKRLAGAAATVSGTNSLGSSSGSSGTSSNGKGGSPSGSGGTASNGKVKNSVKGKGKN